MKALGAKFKELTKAFVVRMGITINDGVKRRCNACGWIAQHSAFIYGDINVCPHCGVSARKSEDKINELFPEVTE